MVATRRTAGLAAALALAGCSVAVGHHNAGIAHLEGARGPAGTIAVGAKYLGWAASAPLVVGLAPLAALLWATPWVDLPLAVDIASAPGIALGYAAQAALGYPARALLFWADPAARPRRAGDAWRAPPVLPTPWGLVVERLPAAPDPRPARPLGPADAARYAVDEAAVDALAARLDVALAATARGEPAALRLDDPRLPATLEVTLADEPGPRPLVVMTPPAEAAFAARWFAARFARRGAHALVVVPDADFLEPHLDAPGVEAKLRAAVVQGRTALHALLGRREVGRVLYVGVSAGGIYGAVLLGVEPRIERAALLLPGGDLPRIIATSQEASVVRFREARGQDPQALERELRQAILTDPLRLAPHVDPSRVMLFLGARDTLVPTECGLRLRRALGGPETVILAGDHDTACLCFGWLLREIDRFLRL